MKIGHNSKHVSCL